MVIDLGHGLCRDCAERAAVNDSGLCYLCWEPRIPLPPPNPDPDVDDLLSDPDDDPEPWEGIED